MYAGSWKGVMFRMSRINVPRGTIAAFALLVIAMLLFGIIAQAHGTAIDSPAGAPGSETPAHVVELSEG